MKPSAMARSPLHEHRRDQRDGRDEGTRRDKEDKNAPRENTAFPCVSYVPCVRYVPNVTLRHFPCCSAMTFWMYFVASATVLTESASSWSISTPNSSSNAATSSM